MMRLPARSQRTGDIGDLIFVSGVERAQRGWLSELFILQVNKELRRWQEQSGSS